MTGRTDRDPHLGRALFGVCLLGWAFATNYTNHAALIPVLMERLRFGPTQAGLLSTALFATLSAVYIPAGILSDRLGPKRIASLGLALTFLGNLGLGYARDFTDLLLIKAAGGVGCGLAFIAGVRYVTVVFPPSHVHRAQGLYGGFVQLGGGTSLYLIPLLHSLLDWRGAFAWSSGLVAITLVTWLLCAPDRRMALPNSRLSAALRSPNVWRLGLVHTGAFGLSIVVGTWITTFLVQDLGLALVTAGAVGSAVLLAGIVSRPLGGIIVDRRLLLTKTVIRISLLTSALGLGLLAFPGRPLWTAVIAILGIGIALSLPYSAVMNTAGASLPESPGAAVGLVSTITTLMISVGAPALGAIYTRTASFSVPFGVLAVFCLLVFWMADRIQGEEEVTDAGPR